MIDKASRRDQDYHVVPQYETIDEVPTGSHNSALAHRLDGMNIKQIQEMSPTASEQSLRKLKLDGSSSRSDVDLLEG